MLHRQFLSQQIIFYPLEITNNESKREKKKERIK